MNGTITVKSEVDKKTVFRVELPVNKKLYIKEKAYENNHRNIVIDWLPAEAKSNQVQLSDQLRPSLLIIDDEQDVRSFLFETFKDNYNITLAVDGLDGLEKLKTSHPQLIICDLMMPRLNGFEVCKKAKTNSDFCHIPFILLTAMDDDSKKIEGFEFGADDYITKPFSIKHLEVRVKTLIENKQHKQFLEKINISIDKNMANSAFGVEELATDIAMSTSHFYRKLKELTGQAPNVYLRNFRLQKAAQLLRANKSLSAADIMFEIGIESKSYFSSTFKKIHGVSPSEFTKKLIN
ncbi:UNVERIFIED_CONTAM: hypothetical protein GTU68_066828 [Idotea baltica]|nr:hypothetical protein [Idotea baltica]